MNILVIRHGQSQGDILQVHEGRADFTLTELGIKQATAMANFISRNYTVDKIYASPLKRAKKTAEILSSTIDIPITYEKDLMEFDNGFLAGLSREEANKRYPEPNIHYPHTSLYNMETTIAFRSRAEAILSKITTENPLDSTIVIIAHGGIINMLFRSFMELPLNSDIFIYTGDTGIHLWQINTKCKRISYTNKLNHIENI